MLGTFVGFDIGRDDKLGKKLETINHKSIIENIIQRVKEIHINEETGSKIVESLSQKISVEKFDEIEDAAVFCEKLTRELQELTHDLHLSVYYDPENSDALIANSQNQPDENYPVDWWSGANCMNYGLPKLEYLMGNIGFIKVIYFAPAPIAGSMVVTAMNYLSSADALIFDLRECSGGDPFTVMMFESYLYDELKIPKLMLTRHCRIETPPQQQFWTYPYLPGKRLPDIPVAILTSSSTFSGGEDMAYTMKHHKRAVIVGEKTAGGAHMVKRIPVGFGCVLRLPHAHPVHPVTNADWDGVGVLPDIAVSKEDALSTAHEDLISRLKHKAESDQVKHKYDWYLQRVKGLYHPAHIDVEKLQRCVGDYRGWQVQLKGERLYLASPSGLQVSEMIPINDNLFIADDDYNAKFRMGDKDQVDALVWIGRDDDQEFVYQRSN